MNNILQKIFLSIVFAVSALAPHTAIAATDSCDKLRKQFEEFGSKEIAELPAYCNVEVAYTKFINLALYAIGIVAVIMFIYGGYVYMTSGGNQERAKKGRSILTWAVVGLVVVLVAATLVNVVVRFIVEK
jgi:hypothetical protein